MDLYGHQKANREKQLENAWIVEHVLMNLTDQQHIIFAVSKADLLAPALPRDTWCDRDSILSQVSSLMPEFNLAGYRARLCSDTCSVLAFAAVATAAKQAPDGAVTRVPKRPLASEGMDMMLRAIANAWRNKIKRAVDIQNAELAAKQQEEEQRFRAQRFAVLKKTAMVYGILLAVVGVIAVLYLYRPIACSACKGSGKTTTYRNCPECEATVTDKIGDRPCDKCNGDGLRKIVSTCGKCNGDGVIYTGTGAMRKSAPCPACDNGKLSEEVPCKTCNGAGKVSKQVACKRCTDGKIAEQLSCQACSGTGDAPK